MINLLNICSEQQFIKFARNDPQFSKVEINDSTRQFLNHCPEQKICKFEECKYNANKLLGKTICKKSFPE